MSDDARRRSATPDGWQPHAKRDEINARRRRARKGPSDEAVDAVRAAVSTKPLSRGVTDEQAVELLLAHPLLRPIAEAARDIGLNPKTAQTLMAKMRRSYLPLLDALEPVQTDGLESMFGNAAEMILKSITTEDIAGAGLRDKMVAAAIAVDKRNLLRGLPTERIAIEDRRALDELLPIILKEAERRAVEIDISPVSNVAVVQTRGPRDGYLNADGTAKPPK